MEKDILEILKMMPHRYPFLLLDRILIYSEDEVVGLKNVTINEPFFQGHFPAHPVMPGVLILEALAQAGGLWAIAHSPPKERSAVYLMGFDKVRFRKPVRPGDQLILKLTLIKQRGAVFKMRGEAFVNDYLVAEAEIMATVDPGKPETEA
jgi:beta-hydroxyacyl-ACP dehydratase FabZ